MSYNDRETVRDVQQDKHEASIDVFIFQIVIFSATGFDKYCLNQLNQSNSNLPPKLLNEFKKLFFFVITQMRKSMWDHNYNTVILQSEATFEAEVACEAVSGRAAQEFCYCDDFLILKIFYPVS